MKPRGIMTSRAYRATQTRELQEKLCARAWVITEWNEYSVMQDLVYRTKDVLDSILNREVLPLP